jgi:hypothetical protein
VDFPAELANQFIQFLLVFSRITGTLTSAPVFASKTIPVYARVGLSALLALFMLPLSVLSEYREPTSLLVLMWWLMLELLYGLSAGFVASLFLQAVQMAGQLIDMQIGFGMVNVFDPQFGQQVPLVGNFKYLIALTIFLALQGHHILISALAENFRAVPLGVHPICQCNGVFGRCRHQHVCDGASTGPANIGNDFDDGCRFGHSSSPDAADECVCRRDNRKTDCRYFHVVFDFAILCCIFGGRL